MITDEQRLALKEKIRDLVHKVEVAEGTVSRSLRDEARREREELNNWIDREL